MCSEKVMIILLFPKVNRSKMKIKFLRFSWQPDELKHLSS